MTEPSGRVLLLRNNRLRGHIPQNLCSLSSIKILDLANTKLNRSIPSCLNNISFGRGSSHDNDHHPLALAWIMNWECIQGPWIYNLSLIRHMIAIWSSYSNLLQRVDMSLTVKEVLTLCLEWICPGWTRKSSESMFFEFVSQFLFRSNTWELLQFNRYREPWSFF